jgi:hypothetical protein
MKQIARLPLSATRQSQDLPVCHAMPPAVVVAATSGAYPSIRYSTMSLLLK